jgi:hypothetical protein
VRISDGLREGFSRRSVLLLSIAQGVLFAAVSPYWLEWPQFFNDAYAASGIWIVGWLYSLFTIVQMAGAEAVIRIGDDQNAATPTGCAGDCICDAAVFGRRSWTSPVNRALYSGGLQSLLGLVNAAVE